MAGESCDSDSEEGDEYDDDEESDLDILNDIRMESATGSWLQAGACSACGMRPSNEDRHLMCCDWSPVDGQKASLFAVFDGHGGSAVATLMAQLLARKCRSVLQAELNGAVAWRSEEGREAAIKRAFAELDHHLSTKDVAFASGTTCVAAIAWHDAASEPDQPFRVLLANIGDSRGLVVRGSGEASLGAEFDYGLLLGETEDHKPECEFEKMRIVAAGGCVRQGLSGLGPLRVDGDLAMSRALGDFRLKDNADLPPEMQKVSAEPDIYEFTCRPGDVVVLACDGAFDVLESGQVAKLATCKHLYAQGPQASARAVVTTALERGSMDNVTCVVVRLGELELRSAGLPEEEDDSS